MITRKLNPKNKLHKNYSSFHNEPSKNRYKNIYINKPSLTFFQPSLSLSLTEKPKTSYTSKRKIIQNSEKKKWVMFIFKIINNNPFCYKIHQSLTKTNNKDPLSFHLHHLHRFLTNKKTIFSQCCNSTALLHLATVTKPPLNVVQRCHLPLNDVPRSILLTKMISPIMASLPFHFLLVFVAMIFVAVSPHQSRLLHRRISLIYRR